MNEYQPEGISFNKGVAAEGGYTLPMLERAKERGKILEAPVLLCDSDMNLHVSLGGITGIIARDEVVFPIGNESVKDIAILTRVGKTVCFHVCGIERRGGRLVASLSRRSAQKECYLQKISRLSPGDIVKAKVTHLESFGAFLDIGCGIVSLLPIDAISVSRISHPSVRLSVGDLIHVVIRSLSDERVYVSRKELLGSWEENAALFHAGETVPGIVRSIEEYGIFVELTPNLTGLAEIKEGAVVNEGATVYIKSILPERMKIKLVILDYFKKPLPPNAPGVSFLSSETTHIDHWRYSPLCAEKTIETYF